MRTLKALTVMAVAVTLASCGNKEEPKSMPEEIPANTQQVAPTPDTPKVAPAATTEPAQKTMTKPAESAPRVGEKVGDGSVTTSTSKKTKASTTIEEPKPAEPTVPDGGITTTTTKKKK